MNPKDVRIAAEQRNSKETTDPVRAAATAANGKPQGEQIALLFICFFSDVLQRIILKGIPKL